MKFDTSAEAREFIESVYPRIGARNQAVLGRAAVFLALGEGVPKDFRPRDSRGVTLNDEQVIGDELRDLIRAALNHRAGKTLDETEYRQEFRRCFEFGCKRLQQIWTDSGHDQAEFVSALLRLQSDEPFPGDRLPKEAFSTSAIVDTEVRLKVLNDAPEWSLNGPGTSNGLLVISGQPGTGKSQLALDMLAQLANLGVRFVFFDMKGELEDNLNNPGSGNLRSKFLQQTRARYVRLIQQSLPINPLYGHPNPSQNAQVATEISSLIRAFAPQLGAKQEMAIREVYKALGSPDFESLTAGVEDRGGTGVELAILKKIVDIKLFASADQAIEPAEWLSESIVIDFKEFGNDTNTKALAVALILNFMIKKLNQQLPVRNDVQPIKMVLFVDEAHLLLPKEGKAGLLGALARQGRSWGFPVWLASQDADAFITSGANATNFAELAECGVHFSTNMLSDAEQKAILGGTLRKLLSKGEAAVRLGHQLSTGMARQFWKEQGS